MRHSYIVFWEDSTSEVMAESGWYCQVSNLIPWGPFDSQAEALESMMMEWPRFEGILGSGCNSTCESPCSPEDCKACQIGCCNV
jgi:hypothetical protein